MRPAVAGSGICEGGPRAASPRPRPSWAASLTAGLALAAACTDLFGPGRTTANPQLSALTINDLSTSLRNGGILYIDGYPADTSFRLGSNQRVSVQISVTSGDREDVGLYRFACPPRERGWHFECFDFAIAMQSGLNAASLADRVAAMGGRFQVISVSGMFAGVTLFAPGDIVSKARAAEAWPGVAYAELESPICLEVGPYCGSLSQLALPVPVDTGPAVPGDGIVQVRSGDTVVVGYRQPLGGVLEARAVVP